MAARTRAPRPTYLSVEDVAEQYAVTVTTVRTWIRLGELPAYRIGAGRGLLRLKVADVDALLVPVEPTGGQP